MSNGEKGWEEVLQGAGEEGEAPPTRTIGGIPWERQMGQYGPTYGPVPTGYQPDPNSRYLQLLDRFSRFAGSLGGVPGLGSIGTGLGAGIAGMAEPFASAYPQQFMQPQWNYPGMGGGGAQQALRYDPFSQELSAAQFQEQMRQFQVGQQQFNIGQEMERARLGLSRGQLGVQQGQLGLQRGQFLQQALSTPANVFSSFFLSRGQVPPYNAQLANILNVQGQGQPFFGALNPTPAETAPMPGIPAFQPLPVPNIPPMPGVPTPRPPQAIPYAKGGTYIPAEPAVAIGLHSGQPLFTFNEQAPAKTEKVKITPQKKGTARRGGYIPPGLPSLQGGGTVYTGPPPGQGGYNPRSGWYAGPGGWENRGLGNPPTPAISPEFSAYPEPLGDAFTRGFPQFPFLQNLGLGQGLQMPQMGQALHGFPLPSPQALNRMSPSEGASMMDMFNTVFGVPGEDVLWASMLPFQGLRGGMPAMRRID